ncbi:hypothetical protein B0H63DRAFT_221714 [Podospora didyma]|uniref:UvrD-like helicase C-terminal domain-containing protein n=1 Tax=Podospora didyma TaxID=330526 RepID=A0AAE0KKD9_9PEZI|nr:hypothetical protein B0H63DRAFT_221714 [Podospora didyma]
MSAEKNVFSTTLLTIADPHLPRIRGLFLKLMFHHPHTKVDHPRTVDGIQYDSRRQFTLTIAYAITIHKSQSATLDKAVVGISQRHFQLGLTYTKGLPVWLCLMNCNAWNCTRSG